MTLWRQFHRDERGVAFVEFALTLPFLMLLFMGVVEMSRYLLINLKLDKASHTISDVVAQAATLSTGDMDQLMLAINDLVSPYAFGSNGRIAISSVSPSGGTPRVRWQYCGGGSLNENSKIGDAGGVAALPSSLSLAPKEDVIAAEIFYRFEPLAFASVLPGRDVYKVSWYRPRLGALDKMTLTCEEGG